VPKIAVDKTHVAFREELIGVMKKYGDDLSAIELLAITSVLLGQMIAVQDQTKYTSKQIMDLVAKNLELGNQEAVDNLMNSQGNA
jgi:hypothetical protein